MGNFTPVINKITYKDQDQLISMQCITINQMQTVKVQTKRRSTCARNLSSEETAPAHISFASRHFLMSGPPAANVALNWVAT